MGAGWHVRHLSRYVVGIWLLLLLVGALVGALPSVRSEHSRSRPPAAHASVGRTVEARVVTAGHVWHFPAPAYTRGAPLLVLFNPTRQAVEAWVRVIAGTSTRLEHVSIAAGSVRQIRLHLVGRVTSVSLQATGNVVPLQLMDTHREVRSTFALPGLDRGRGTIPMPSRFWTFPALKTSAGATLLTVYNPNTFPVSVRERFAGNKEWTGPIQVAARSSTDLTLSTWGGGGDERAFAVTATGPIVPQRSTIGVHGTTSAYGAPGPS